MPEDLRIEPQNHPVFDNLKPHASSLVFCQSDVYNCGVWCSLFMYDMMITQTFQTWKLPVEDNGTLPKSFKFGSLVLKEDFYKLLPKQAKGFNLKNHLKNIYDLFREELVILMERLQFLQIENTVGLDNMIIHSDSMWWGQVTEKWTINAQNLQDHLKVKDQVVNKKLINYANNMEDNKSCHALFDDSYVCLNKTANFAQGNIDIINANLSSSFPDESKFEEAVNAMYEPSFHVLQNSQNIENITSSSFATQVQASNHTVQDESQELPKAATMQSESDKESAVALVLASLSMTNQSEHESNAVEEISTVPPSIVPAQTELNIPDTD